MANQIYKEHLLIWTAVHNKETDSWTPAATISWKVKNRYKFHRLNGLSQISQQEALALAKQLAETWVDKELRKIEQ